MPLRIVTLKDSGAATLSNAKIGPPLRGRPDKPAGPRHLLARSECYATAQRSLPALLRTITAIAGAETRPSMLKAAPQARKTVWTWGNTYGKNARRIWRQRNDP